MEDLSLKVVLKKCYMHWFASSVISSFIEHNTFYHVWIRPVFNLMQTNLWICLWNTHLLPMCACAHTCTPPSVLSLSHLAVKEPVKAGNLCESVSMGIHFFLLFIETYKGCRWFCVLLTLSPDELCIFCTVVSWPHRRVSLTRDRTWFPALSVCSQ